MKNRKNPNLVERIQISKEELIKIERGVIVSDHLKRYAFARRFCYGRVLDFASGCGYGSFLLAGNPEVKYVTAIDIDKGLIEWAKREFWHEKINYVAKDIKLVKGKYDTIVCLETIEHLKDMSVVPRTVERCKINNIILSFPDKKTTHYNNYHFHDLIKQEVIDLFKHHVVYHTVRFVDSQIILMTRLPNNAPHHIFRNIRDL